MAVSPAAAHADNTTAVHQASTQATAALHKLSAALVQVGADPASIKQVNSMATAVHTLAVTVSGAASGDSETNEPAGPEEPEPQDIQGAAQALHAQMAGPRQPAFQ